MTLPVGVFIALGITAYVILWRYIFLQFFKLVEPYENSQDSYHEPEPNFFDIFFSNCTKSSDENYQESCQIVANILPQEHSITSSFELSTSSPALEKVEHSDKILDAYKFLKLCLRSGIGRCGKSMLTKKDKSRNPKLRDMEVADDVGKDMRKSGNIRFRDIDGSFGTFEMIECHAKPSNIIPDVQLGREENDLNTMIRRLVAAELMKCCEKEHGAMSRAHSDTNNRVCWKRNKYRKQAVNSHANAPSFDEYHQRLRDSTCDSGNPESVSTYSILSKKSDDVMGKRMYGKGTPTFVTENIPKDDQSCNSNDDNDKGGVENVVIALNDASISSRNGCSIKNLSEPENATSIEELETQIIKTTGEDTILQSNPLRKEFEDASTQTEHMYMIRAVRSCPGRRRRLQLLEGSRGMSKARSGGNTIPIEISLPAFLYRKASDNLIYEMGKGSRSPSYIPVPERFRWRYVTPTKVNLSSN